MDFYSIIKAHVQGLSDLSASSRGALYRIVIAAFERFAENRYGGMQTQEVRDLRKRLLDAIDKIEDEFEVARTHGLRAPAWAVRKEGIASETITTLPPDPQSKDAPARKGRIVSALRTARQRPRVIAAVLRHYIHVIAGAERLGYLWMMVEPLIQVFIIVAMYWFFGVTVILGMPALPFAIIGVSAWLLFRQIMMRACYSLGREQVLCTYPVVHPLDVKTAKAIFYFLLYTVNMVIYFAFLYVANIYTASIDRPLETIVYWGGIGVLSFGASLALARLLVAAPITLRFIAIILRALYLMSGFFIISEQLPEQASGILLWNPMVHGMQLVRAAFFIEYESYDASAVYFWATTFMVLVFGLLCERLNYREEIG